VHFGKRLANLLGELVHSGFALSHQPVLMRFERLHAPSYVFTLTHGDTVNVTIPNGAVPLRVIHRPGTDAGWIGNGSAPLGIDLANPL
jgi:hypothetical protein